jgi:polar amino acid transport system substrate-binding protein
VLKKLLGLYIVVLLFLAAPLAAQDNEIKNGIGASFPPFAYLGPDGKPTGFDVEALNWIAEKAGLTVVHTPLEWDGIIGALKDKKIDVIAAGLSITPERAEQIAFTKPYWTITHVVVVKNDSPLSLEEALTTGKKIGVQRGTSDEAAMEEANNKNGRKYSIVPYESFGGAIDEVISGNLDAVVLNDESADKTAAEKPIKILGDAGIPIEEFAYGVNKDNPELLTLLNEGLTALMADPYWLTLTEKYKPGEVQ